jgi:hypothetical protein
MSHEIGEYFVGEPFNDKFYLLAVDFVANEPLLNELEFEPRKRAVDITAALVMETESLLAAQPEGFTYVSFEAENFVSGVGKAIADHGRVKEGIVVHDIYLWNIGHLREYLLYRRGKLE